MIGAAKLPYFQNAVGWSPALLSQVWLWLTAGPTWCFTDAGGTTPCADGDAVYVWKDRSGNAHDLVQSSSGSRPLLKLVGGQWRVRFDGSDDQMASATIATWPTSVGFCSARFGIVATGGNYSPIQCSDGVDSDFWRYVGGGCYSKNFRATRYDNAFSPSDTVSRHTWTQTSDTDYRIYSDGVQVGTTQAADWSAPSVFKLAEAASGLFLGNIDIAGVVAGASTLSGANRALLEAYLAGLLT